jgi:hypothetical protein
MEEMKVKEYGCWVSCTCTNRVALNGAGRGLQGRDGEAI